VASHPITKVSAEEYLAQDRAAEFRSEFLDGEIVAMSGGSARHSIVTVNLTREISTALRGKSCQAFNSDLRVRVSPRMYTYPDLTVVCGRFMLADERQDILLNPTVIFELLSPSTEKYDRGIKLQSYRSIESLQDYILVAQDQIRIEQYTRGEANVWTFRDYQGAKENLVIASIQVSLPLSGIYDRVEFPPELAPDART
jgi:Uma2 family endonuclease